MVKNRQEAGLRGLVQRTETNASQSIQWPNQPTEEDRWLDEICVYDLEGRLLEWYSPENQILEQESIMHRFVYDADGNLVEKRGYAESGAAEDVTKYFYDDKSKLVKRVRTYPDEIGGSHVFYDDRGNVVLFKNYDSSNGSLNSVQKYHYTYKEHGSRLDARFYREEGNASILIRDPRDYRTVTTFDGSGNKIRVEIYFSDWVEQVDIFNASGKLIEHKLYSDRETVAWQNSYRYDQRGNLVETIFTDRSSRKTNLSEYDDWNSLVKSSSYEDGVLTREDLYAYEYDAYFNWVKRSEKVRNNSGFRSATDYFRKINYFTP